MHSQNRTGFSSPFPCQSEGTGWMWFWTVHIAQNGWHCPKRPGKEANGITPLPPPAVWLTKSSSSGRNNFSWCNQWKIRLISLSCYIIFKINTLKIKVKYKGLQTKGKIGSLEWHEYTDLQGSSLKGSSIL